MPLPPTRLSNRRALPLRDNRAHIYSRRIDREGRHRAARRTRIVADHRANDVLAIERKGRGQSKLSRKNSGDRQTKSQVTSFLDDRMHVIRSTSVCPMSVAAWPIMASQYTPTGAPMVTPAIDSAPLLERTRTMVRQAQSLSGCAGNERSVRETISSRATSRRCNSCNR